MRFPQTFIDDLRRQADIVRIVQDYVSLKKTGANWVARCPFHKETKPSFSVNPAKEIFYCFGCQKGGSVFNFIMEIERVTFPEAVRVVAEKSGVLETKVLEGQEVTIGEVIAIIDDSKGAPKEKKSAALEKKTPEEKKKEAEPEKKAATVAASGNRGRPAAAAELAQPESTPPVTALSPAVRRIVEEENLEPLEISGTGTGGRVTKADALAAVEARGKVEEQIDAAKLKHQRTCPP